MLFQIIVIQIITFSLIVFALRKMLYSDSARESRRLRELSNENLRREREITRKEQETEKLFAEKIASANAEVIKIRLKGESDVEELKKSLIADAEQEAAGILKSALSDREKIKEELSLETKSQVPLLALRIMKDALSEPVRELIHRELVLEVIHKSRELEKEQASSSLRAVEIVSARALTKTEKENLLEALFGARGKRPPVEEKLDNDLIAGLLVRLDTLVIDGTLRDRLERMARAGK